jgi:hypothetical protein
VRDILLAMGNFEVYIDHIILCSPKEKFTNFQLISYMEEFSILLKDFPQVLVEMSFTFHKHGCRFIYNPANNRRVILIPPDTMETVAFIQDATGKLVEFPYMERPPPLCKA